jgi:hypothetical protein
VSVTAFLSRFVVKVVDPQDHSFSTGFFVGDAGFLLTCWHVADPDFAGALRAWVWVEYRGRRYKAHLQAHLSRRGQDLAVLQVRGSELSRLRKHGFEVAPLGFAHRPCDPVAALGYQRLDVVSDALLLPGHIDAHNTPLAVPVTPGVEQACLAITFRHAHCDLGMSGAPLLNLRTGRVIGVVAGLLDNRALSSRRGQVVAEPLGFAVPLSAANLSWGDHNARGH